ncbi:hypothetical protein MMC34_003212 [Xylographa carneopallida]|nr:hypothetical protein [Xylographa carneopallida]
MASPNGLLTAAPAASQQPLTQTPPHTTTSAGPAPPPPLHDDALSKRPRDARLIHMVLANAGITSYQERVPLQLMDFAYRYTSAALQDALHLTHESYGTGAVAPGAGRGGGGGVGGGGGGDANAVSLLGLRLSVASRTHYQFAPALPKEFYAEVAAERNRVTLPAVGREWGRRLPPERYCLTGVGWGLKGGEDGGKGGEGGGEVVVREEEEEEEEEEDARMEDFFGEGEAEAEGGEDGDRDMGRT